MDVLGKLLNLYWLRPETAAWRAVDILALADIDFEAPILDLGCGDGLFSFIRAGGGLDSAFDAFLGTGDLDRFFDNADIYDHAGVAPVVTEPPAYRIALGLDHKAALLGKAAALGLYDQTMEADANKPLPLDSGSFRTVYSNVLYWLDQPAAGCAEMHRILAPGGQLIVQVPSDTFDDYSFFRRYGALPGFEWLTLIDRGRSGNIQHRQDLNLWQRLFEGAGFEIVHHRRYLHRTLLEAWDIGLRPLSPYLIEMANTLDGQARSAIKRKWVAGLLPMIEPLVRLDWPTDADSPAGFFLFVLQRR